MSANEDRTVMVISKNEKRNMQMAIVTENGVSQTRHMPIDSSKPSKPKTNGRGKSAEGKKKRKTEEKK
jgi:hypothetical protein